MKISEMSEDDAKQHLYDSYMSAHDAYANDPEGTEGRHPSKDVSRWREAAAGAAVDEGGLGPVRIQRGGSATDDDQPEISGGIAGEHPTVDGVLSSDAQSKPIFTFADGRTVVGDKALEASARCSNPARVRRVASAIKGYDRLK